MIIRTWDALGRPLTETTYGRTVTSTWDLAGRMTGARENGATSGPGVLASYSYDALGRRTSLSRGAGVVTTWTYAPNSRDASMTHDLSGTAHDVTVALTFNPAGQAVSRDTSNPAYAFVLPTQAETPYVRDGLNRYDAVAGVAFTHDARGNLMSIGVLTYRQGAHTRFLH